MQLDIRTSRPLKIFAREVREPLNPLDGINLPGDLAGDDIVVGLGDMGGAAPDLAGAYSDLAGEGSRWTTGSALVVDGGYSAP